MLLKCFQRKAENQRLTMCTLARFSASAAELLVLSSPKTYFFAVMYSTRPTTNDRTTMSVLREKRRRWRQRGSGMDVRCVNVRQLDEQGAQQKAVSFPERGVVVVCV